MKLDLSLALFLAMMMAVSILGLLSLIVVTRSSVVQLGLWVSLVGCSSLYWQCSRTLAEYMEEQND